jgi:hypothetical protein
MIRITRGVIRTKTGMSRIGRFVVGDLLGVLQGAVVAEVGGGAGGPEGVAAGPVRQPGSPGPPLDHVEGVAAGERLARELAGLTCSGVGSLGKGNDRFLDDGQGRDGMSNLDNPETGPNHLNRSSSGTGSRLVMGLIFSLSCHHYQITSIYL